MKAVAALALFSALGWAQGVVSLHREKAADGAKVVVNFSGPPPPGCLTAAIKFAPYSAEQATEKTRTLADGTQIVERTPVTQMSSRRGGPAYSSSVPWRYGAADEDPIELDAHSRLCQERACEYLRST